MPSNLTSTTQAFQYDELPVESGRLGGLLKAEPAFARRQVTPTAQAQVVRLPRPGSESAAAELSGDELRARCVAADEASDGVADLAGTWRSLLAGAVTVSDSFHESDRCYLVLEPRKGGPVHFSPRKLAVLEHVLVGGRHKVTTTELKISASTVSMVARQALAHLGLDCTPSKVPLLLCVLAHAGRSGHVRGDARVSVVRTGDTALSVLSITRPDFALNAKLSRGELAVLSGLVEGMSHKQIAEQREASSHTVANQLTSAFRRLGLSGRLELLQSLAVPNQGKRSPEPEPSPASSPPLLGALDEREPSRDFAERDAV